MTKIQELKAHVSGLAQNPSFKHHQWFLEYHLQILEKLVLELCEFYPEADKEMVLTLVWIHDYEKILGVHANYHSYVNTRACLAKLGFSTKEQARLISYLEIIDKKLELDLNQAAIEIKIVSCADAASHLLGPFYYLWWYENNKKGFRELMQDNYKKAQRDWQYKIVLPEVKRAFEQRHQFLMEQSGFLPEKYFSGLSLEA